jgi:hypothetical protein
VGPRAGLDGAENLTSTGIRFPDRGARSEPFYRLSYRSTHAVANARISLSNSYFRR